MPRDEKQEALLRSQEALTGRFTYYSGETQSNTPTYPASGINPLRIGSIYTEVITTGRVLQKADMDDQVMRRDTHLRATDGARVAAVVSKQVYSTPANQSDLARDLAYLGQAMIDDTDNFDHSCGRLLKANRSGYGSGEAVFAHKALHVAGRNLSIPGAWPQQIDEVYNRNYRFDPIKDEPLLNQASGKFVPIDRAKWKILFHEGVGDGPVRMRGHLTCTIWPHMIKHDGIARLAQCLDFYGIPHPFAEMDWEHFQNEELKQATRDAMADFGSGNPYIKVKEVLWGFTDLPAGLDARGMHGLLWGLCNTEQSKAVQGETLTTELGGVGSYNASETHADVKADIVALDERGLASTIRKWMRAVFILNMPALCRAFGATPVQILGCIPKVYWLIHRAMDPEVRQRMRFAAVAAGLAIDREQEYRENGWAKPTHPDEAISGEGVIVRDGAKSVGSLEAAHGADNPKETSIAEPAAPAGKAKQPETEQALTNGAMSQRGALAALAALAGTDTDRNQRKKR